MNSYPHAPDETVFQSNLVAATGRLVPEREVTPALLAGRNQRFFPLNAATGLECGCRAYALGRERETILGFFRESSWSFAQAIEAQAPIHLADVTTHLALAVILRNDARIKTIGALPRERYTSPDMEFPESLYEVEEVLADLAEQRFEPAAGRVARALPGLAAKKLPRALRNDIEPLFLLQKAIVERDQAGLEGAYQTRLAAYAKKFKDPSIRNMAEGALDLRGLGLARLAIDRGLSPGVESVYLPLSFLEA